MKKSIASMIWILSVVGHSAFSQQDYSGLVYSNPLELNPAFTGSTLNSRIVANFFSHQYPATYGYNLSYDSYIPKLKMGIGLQTSFVEHYSSFYSADVATSRMGILLSKALLRQEKYEVVFATKVDYLNNRATTKYEACEGCRYAFIPVDYEVPTYRDAHAVTFTPAVLVRGRAFAGGIGVRDVNQPDVSPVKGMYEELSRALFSHFTYQWFWRQGKLGLAPDVLMSWQGSGSYSYDLGTTMKYGSIRFGLRARATTYGEGWNALLGMQRKRWSFSVAYGMMQSFLQRNSSDVSGGLSAQYNLGYNKNDRKRPTPLIAF